MGRKKESTAKRDIYCIRISEEEKALLKNNPTLKSDLDSYVRMYLNAFIDRKEQ
ncbi:MAG: hypothetical protein ACRC41_01235 [Sarcina sp.]